MPSFALIGAFIIPYFTVLVLGAVPVFFMELSMGQFSKEGPINVWNNLAPMFRGKIICKSFMLCTFVGKLNRGNGIFQNRV